MKLGCSPFILWIRAMVSYFEDFTVTIVLILHRLCHWISSVLSKMVCSSKNSYRRIWMSNNFGTWQNFAIQCSFWRISERFKCHMRRPKIKWIEFLHLSANRNGFNYSKNDFHSEFSDINNIHWQQHCFMGAVLPL